MSNRTFASIHLNGHPLDPQQWEAVDEAYRDLRLAQEHASLALSLLEDLELLPDTQTQLSTVISDIQATLQGKPEDRE